MTLRPVLAAVAFTTLILAATAASACPWTDAQAGGGDQQVASSATGQGTQQTPPAKTN